MVGILFSYWDDLFSGALLVSGSVHLRSSSFLGTAFVGGVIMPKSAWWTPKDLKRSNQFALKQDTGHIKGVSM